MKEKSIVLKLLEGLQGLPIEQKGGPETKGDCSKITYWEEVFLIPTGRLIFGEPEEEERHGLDSNLNGEFVAHYIKDNYPGYEPLDPEGGCLFKHQDKTYKLLNTYGDEDNYFPYLALCIAIIHEPGYFEALDCKIEGGQLVPYKLWGGRVPKELQHEDLGVGKRGYYLYRELSEVSLRANIKAYRKTPEKYRDGGPNEFISSPRVKFQLAIQSRF